MSNTEKNLPTKYDHMSVEEGLYQWWLEGKYFEATGDEKKQPYTIVIPPPNVTGKLHLGHAWDTTLQDILTRTKRMQGYDVLWLPGMKCWYRNTSESRRKTSGRRYFTLRSWP